ncbi:disease resistance protein adr2 [Quercus suber]|uniref:Disease resistance protein adr2 n=1 Tax=Quercus suber TaxID=58331 RepID=A0AAW0IXS3_QUESU
MHKTRHIEFSSSLDLYLQLIQPIMSFLCSMLCSSTEFEFIQRGFQYENLTMISLRSCEFITKLPDLCCPNLEKLDLGDCKNLIEVHESIGFLEKLKVWNLEGCSQLQILPSMLMLKSLKHFNLCFCGRLEKFPDIHPEMNCLSTLDSMTWFGVRIEVPSALSWCPGIEDGLDSWMQPDYFPVLIYLWLSETGIVTIPESISRFTTLKFLHIASGNSETSTIYKNRECIELRSAGYTIIKQIIESVIKKQFMLNFNFLQFREILAILPNTVAEVATECWKFKWPRCNLTLPVTEIPKWLKINHHQSVGNSVSFLVGPKLSNLVVCIAFPSKDVPNYLGDRRWRMWFVHISINGKTQSLESSRGWAKSNYDHLWLMYWKVNISNPSEENRIEVENAYVVLRNPIYLLPHLWINVLSTMGKKIQAMLESDADCEEETIDQPMLDVPKNTTLDGFESDTNSGNKAPNPGDG